ncbi:hypothetical protein NPIL_527891 [Nephila pilipes]|uniref:Uncharacterized protein n=1 Tax=Nephila pilipes TaxID=299642 RepID=A0A8X6N018_NEPPI|nr:hypothetical protein NPIL_527891 [Nephila pilipes]
MKMPCHVTEGGAVGYDLDLPRVWLNLLPDPQARSLSRRILLSLTPLQHLLAPTGNEVFPKIAVYRLHLRLFCLFTDVCHYDRFAVTIYCSVHSDTCP